MINERLLPQPDIAPSGNLPSGYFNTVTYTGNGGTQKIGGYINRAAVFNGSNSTISTPITDNYSNLSISCWVKFNALPTGGADATLVSKGFYVSGSNTQYLQLRYEDFIDQFTFAIRQNNTYNQQATSGVTASVGVWYNVVGTLDSSGNAQIYVNGSAGTGTTSAPTMTNSDNFEIGSFANTVALLNGSIDQVRIFNKELSSTEVTTLYGETFASASKSVTDIFSDGSAVALYQLDGNANDTGGLDYVFTTWDSTLSSVPNYSEGNLRMTGGSGNKIGYSVDSVSSGKWYWEHEVIAIGAESSFGIARPGDLGSHYVVGTSSTSWGLYVNGNLYHNGSVSTSGYMSGGFSNGDIIGVELDLDNGTLEFYKNGTGYGNAFTGLSGKFLVAAESRTSSGNNDHRTNFGSTAWDYTPSTGFAGINTEYNGTASNVTYQEATNFSPDLVWIKDRDTNYAHQLYDTVRGVTKKLHPNTTAAEATDSTGLTSFDSNGFTISTNVGINTNNNDYVSWCFNAGGSPTATNSAGAGNVPTAGSVKIDGADLTTALAGTIPATKISANQKAGFSIVKYTGVNSNSTVGHGLSSAPEIRIIKGLSTGTTETQNWFTWVAGIGTNNEMILNGTGVPAYTASVMNQNQTLTSTIFPIGFDPRVNQSGKDYIAYCFHSVDGIQKVGRYTGNGSSNGPFIHTGFKPAFLLIKNTSNAFNWYIRDNARSTNNPLDLTLAPNLASAEDSAWSDGIDFLSNGFKVKLSTNETNQNNNTFLYMAFAEDSEKHSNAVATLGDGNEFIQDANYPQDNFSATTYTGNATGSNTTSQGITTGVDADLVWVKNRDNANNHVLFDSIRGATNWLNSNNTNAEYNNQYTADASITSNGFTTGTSDQTNRQGNDFVAWSWKAAGHEYKSAFFNGSSSKIELPSALSDGSTIDASCISFWFNVGAEVTSSTTNNEIMQFAGTSSVTGKIALGSTSGHMSGETFSVTSNVSGTYTYSRTNIPAGWNHAVVQWNSSDAKWDIYINTVKHTTYTYGTQAQRKFKLRFGHRSSYYYAGRLDQIRIFNRAISPTEVATLYNETKATVDTLQVLGDTSCIATYRLNGDARDLSGNYHGTESNIDYQKGSHFAYNIYENKARTFSHKGSDLSLNTGTITPDSINANRDNGFSIIKHTGTGVQHSMCHGLSKPPEIIITKRLDDSNNWNVYSESLGLSHTSYSNWLYLNVSNDEQDSSNKVNHPYYQKPSSSLIYQNTGTSELSNVSNSKYITYAWHSVPGFSKIGSFTGTGSSGNKIFTGFEPAFLMVKGTSIAGNWTIFHNQRPNENLWANLSNSYSSASTTNNFSFNSDGFTSLGGGGSTNSNNHNYIYIAFAHR